MYIQKAYILKPSDANDKPLIDEILLRLRRIEFLESVQFVDECSNLEILV